MAGMSCWRSAVRRRGGGRSLMNHHEQGLPEGILLQATTPQVLSQTLRAMARTPRERYQSASEFSTALAAWSPASSPCAASPPAISANNRDEGCPATEVKARAWKHRVVSALKGRPLFLL